jgi:Dihaem cytochrome c
MQKDIAMNRARLNRAVVFAGAALLVATALGAGLLDVPRAMAEGGGQFPPPRDGVAMKECSACHMAFPPAMLPARSWHKLMAGLDNHFGENASLDPATAQHINDFLVANAADAGGRESRLLRGLDQADTPLRISEMPWWVRAHNGEVRPSAFKDPRVGSKANCTACHRGAAKGYYGDD